MRVLIVPSWYPTDDKPNSGIFFKEQAIALQEEGLEIIVAYPEIHSLKEVRQNKFKRGFYHKVESGLETYRSKEYNFLPKTGSGEGVIYLYKLRKILKRLVKEGKKVDVIHAHSVFWGGWAAAKLAKEYDIPFIMTEHSSAFIRGLIKKSQIKYIKETFDSASKIIAVSEGLKKELINYTCKEKINVIPNIVDTSHFKPNAIFQQNARFRFFSLAFLTPNKGFDILLKAFAMAFKGNKEVELVIGGDGEEKSDLENLAYVLGIKDQVRFLGQLSREQVAVEMQTCNAFVLASHFETFGVVFIEALATGKPIIATKSGGPDTIVNEKNGILVSPNNINELSSALQHIEKNIKKYNSNEIMMDCIERFSKQSIINKILIQYKELLCEGKTL